MAIQKIPLSIEEWTKLYNEQKQFHLVRTEDYLKAVKKTDKHCIGNEMWISQNILTIEMAFKKSAKEKAKIYCTRLDGQEIGETDTLHIISDFRKYYKFPKLHEVDEEHLDDDIHVASPFLYHNKALVGKWRKGVCYDMNAAYGYALANCVLPDTTVPARRYDTLKEGEIGFIGPNVILTPGSLCDFIFPILKGKERQSITDYVNYWYARKLEAKDAEEKKKCKDHINIVVGYFQRCNWFLRASVIDFCNSYIKSLIKDRDDVLYCNTDSICIVDVDGTGIKPIDLPISPTELGKFKVEHEGEVAHTGHAYQWKGQKPKWSGVPSATLSEKTDILGEIIRTPLPYKFDIKKGIINNEEENELS